MEILLAAKTGWLERVIDLDGDELPAHLWVPYLLERQEDGCPLFGLLNYYLTGAHDPQGRPVYGDPQ